MRLAAAALALAGAVHAAGFSESIFSIPDFLRFHAAEEPADPDPSIRRFPGFEGEADSYPGVRLIAPAQYPVFSDDLDAASLKRAAEQSDAYWARLGDAAVVTIAGRPYSVARLRRSAQELVSLAEQGPAALDAGIRARFDVFESVGDAQGQVVFTGYYEPEIPAAASAGGEFTHPVLGRPSDLDSRRPYPTRAQIDRGAIRGRAAELGWAEPTDVFSLQLEGSGWLLFGGRRQRVAYSDHNGRTYRSVEKALRARGAIPAGEDVYSFLKRQPLAERLKMLEVNPRYTFFRLVAEDDGPYGALQTYLTAHRSLAVSPQMPRGCPAFMIVKVPVADPQGALSFVEARRLAFAQDAGNAIDSPGRIDVFWGTGARAAAEAGHMKEAGRLFFLILK